MFNNKRNYNSNRNGNNSRSNSGNEPKKYVKNCYGKLVLNPAYKSWKNSQIAGTEDAVWTKNSEYYSSRSITPFAANSAAPAVRETVPSSNGSSSIESSLNELERIRKLGLLSPAEYKHNRNAILGITDANSVVRPPLPVEFPSATRTTPIAVATPAASATTTTTTYKRPYNVQAAKRLDDLDRMKHLLTPKEYDYNQRALLASFGCGGAAADDTPVTAAVATTPTTIIPTATATPAYSSNNCAQPYYNYNSAYQYAPY